MWRRRARPDCSPSGEESGPLPQATALGTHQYRRVSSGFQAASPETRQPSGRRCEPSWHLLITIGQSRVPTVPRIGPDADVPLRCPPIAAHTQPEGRFTVDSLPRPGLRIGSGDVDDLPIGGDVEASVVQQKLHDHVDAILRVDIDRDCERWGHADLHAHSVERCSIRRMIVVIGHRQDGPVGKVDSELGSVNHLRERFAGSLQKRLPVTVWPGDHESIR